jgi:pimeloyl-ACP methyl ester carboxylesterase
MLNRTTTSFDGVSIAYSVSGTAETALVFIHGGMSDRTFWDGQHAAFADRFQVIALDLAGHGESGKNRPEWGMAQFGRDAVAVMDAEHVSRAVLIGNSLGGPAAIEAALLAPERVLAVIGVDTFHDLGRTTDADAMNHAAEEWQRDPKASLDRGLRMLLHDDMDPVLYEDIRRRMSRTPPEVVCAMYRSLGGYNTGAPATKLKVPIRCVNGDKFSMDLEAVRRVVPDFDAVVLPHIGHYPMLECPEEFNRKLGEVLDGLGVTPSATASIADSCGG